MSSLSHVTITICIFLLSFFISGVSQDCFGANSDISNIKEAYGIISKIEGKKLTVTIDNEDIAIFATNTERISIGDSIRIIYYPITDSGDVFVAEEIEVIQSN